MMESVAYQETRRAGNARPRRRRGAARSHEGLTRGKKLLLTLMISNPYFTAPTRRGSSALEHGARPGFS